MNLEDLWQKLQRLQQDNEYIRRDLEEAEAQPLLTDAEAGLLVQRYRTGANAKMRLENTPPYDPKVKVELEAIASEGDEAIRQLHKGYQWLVMQIAVDYLVGGLRLNDLRTRGNSGLQRAMQTYHHMRHCRFQDFAAVWIERMILVAAAQGNNGIDMLPWPNLAHLQATRRMILKIRLGRSPTYAELAVVMGYLTRGDAAEIVAARRDARSFAPDLANRLGVAIAKTECLHKQTQVAQEFALRMTVMINGKQHEVDHIVSFMLPGAQEVEELRRCGYSVSRRRAGVWLCRKCLQTQDVKGCGHYRIERFVRLGRGSQLPCIELYDGQRFEIEDDPFNLFRQFRL